MLAQGAREIRAAESASAEHSSVDGTGTWRHISRTGCCWLSGLTTPQPALSSPRHEPATHHTAGACLLLLSVGCLRSTQPCIPPGSLNRVPVSAGVRAGMSPPPDV